VIAWAVVGGVVLGAGLVAGGVLLGYQTGWWAAKGVNPQQTWLKRYKAGVPD
jgi:hypothetical protein